MIEVAIRIKLNDINDSIQIFKKLFYLQITKQIVTARNDRIGYCDIVFEAIDKKDECEAQGLFVHLEHQTVKVTFDSIRNGESLYSEIKIYYPNEEVVIVK